MAEQYRRKALMDQFGLEDDPTDPHPGADELPETLTLDPSQQNPIQTATDPGPRVEAPETGAATAAAPSWNKGVNANNGMILGYDLGKLNDKGYNTGKYNPAVRAFSEGLKNDVGVSRGGLGNMLNFLKANGFANAQLVGDDKIDFGDGAGPIDVIRGDGQIVFQDPRGVDPNAGGGMGAPGAGGMPGPQANDSFLGGNPLDAIRAELAKLMGGTAKPNLQALLQQFGGGAQ